MKLSIAFAVLLSAAAAGAQSNPARDSTPDTRGFSFYDRGPYRASVPRPESILGYAIGDMNTQYAMQEKTLLAIADAAKDRVRVEEYGSSYERRTMRLFIVSSPENISRLDAIRADLDKIGDPRKTAAGELDAIAARTPAVIWLTFSVHGNESPGFETAIQLLYQLAASDEPATVEALKNTIVIINPSANPDGHERFTVWYNSVNVQHPDPGANEHDEPWSVQGRYNHYRFDMNRDVMASTQREVQGMMRGILRWHPVVVADLHGVVERYFFPPVAKAINENVGGEAFEKWMQILGKGNAQAFDKYGWMYFNRGFFDFYYVGYWDVWPSLQGASGMTFETDGGGWKGILWRRDDGSYVSFLDGIAKHYVAAMATIGTTSGRKAERVRDYLRFRQNAIAEGRTGTMKRIVLVPGNDPGRAAELVGALLRAGIEVRRAGGAFSSTRAHAYYDDGISAKRFDNGAYVIDLAQPQGKVAKAFLEPTPDVDAGFVNEQGEKYRRNVRRGRSGVREGYDFYDITAWSMPVAYGVEAYWTEDATPVTGDLLSLPAEEPALPQAQNQPRRVGGELLAVDIPGGIIGGAHAKSAYLFKPDRNGASRLTYHLLNAGFKVSVATEVMEAEGKTWPRGTYIISVARNDTSLYTRLDALARESGVEITPINTLFAEKAQYGIGSYSAYSLVTPKVALVGDEGISQTGYGAIWYTFERRYGIRFMPIGIGYLSGGDLTKFNVIIIPDASGGALAGRLGKDGADRIRSWVQNGGTLITMGGATGWAARESVNLTSARAVGSDEKDTVPSMSKNPASDDTTKAKRMRSETPDKAFEEIPIASPSSANYRPQPLPGSHFDVVLDRTHWLAYGYENPRLTVMLDGSTFLKPSKDGANVAVFAPTGKLTRAGFTFPDNTERLLRGTSLLIEESTGDGHVILFANEPMFRGWWRALDRLVLNGVILGPTF